MPAAHADFFGRGPPHNFSIDSTTKIQSADDWHITAKLKASSKFTRQTDVHIYLNRVGEGEIAFDQVSVIRGVVGGGQGALAHLNWGVKNASSNPIATGTITGTTTSTNNGWNWDPTSQRYWRINPNTNQPEYQGENSATATGSNNAGSARNLQYSPWQTDPATGRRGRYNYDTQAWEFQ